MDYSEEVQQLIVLLELGDWIKLTLPSGILETTTKGVTWMKTTNNEKIRIHSFRGHIRQ